MPHAPTYHAPRKGRKIRPAGSRPSRLARPGLSVFRSLLPDRIVGFEKGYNQNADVITQTADGADLNKMWDEFQQTINLLNRDRNALLNLLVFNVTDPVEQVRYPAGDEFEDASEFGEPKGVRLGPAFNMGFPFGWKDLAARFTWQFLAESSQRQVEGINASVLEADVRLQFLTVLKSLFSNVNSTATINGQAVTVFRLYNGDGVVPPAWKNFVHTAPHTHYLASGGATFDSGDVRDIETHLRHHGYGITFGTRQVLLVSRQEGLIVRKFKAPTDDYDFIPSPGAGGGLVLPTPVVGAPAGTVPGEIGTYGPFHVVEEDYIPSGYVIGFATGGDRALPNLVGLREHDNAALRGLKLARGRVPDYPLIDSFYVHGLGAGVRHRGAGVVMKVTAGAYDIPAAYA